MTEEQVRQLLEKYQSGLCTPGEREQLEQWLDIMAVSGKWDWTREEKMQFDRKLRADICVNTGVNLHKAKIVSFRFRRIAIAASILLLVGIGTAIVFSNNKESEAVNVSLISELPAPDKNRATITVGGKSIYLDSAASGTLLTQGGINIVKTDDGRIVYQSGNQDQEFSVQYNTLSNPRGSKVIDMQLADGSHIWLNAGSSVTYPVPFTKGERRIAITGEAYFEVAQDKTKPFFVSKDNMEIQVLGTHFNVNAYDDESDIKVTLLEGSVKVSNGKENTLLKPAQQAVVSGSDVQALSNIDSDEIMAWKNGRFQFSDASLQTILRQAARWYDFEVEYEGIVNEQFSGAIPRTVNALQLFKILESTDKLRIKTEGKKIIVQPN